MNKKLILVSAIAISAAVAFSTINSQENEMSFFITSEGSGDGANHT